MRRALTLALFAIALAGCQGETARPSPTGKGSVRMINALDDAPEVSFYIEERFLETVAARSGSGFVGWDDFSYDFHFETNVIGERESRRFVTRNLKVEADREFTLIVSGDYEDATVTVWETPERNFDGSETIFEARFANLSTSAGRVDFYLLAPGTDPVLGQQIGTLGRGEFLDSVDIEEGDYVLAVTAAGDPSNVLFEAAAGTYVSSNVSTFALYDASGIDTAPYVVQLIGNSGGGNALRDSRFAPTVRFFQASFSLADSDVYDDEALTNLVLPDHRFGDISGDIPVAVGQTSYTYTAVGNTSVTQFTTGITAQSGLVYNLVVVSEDDARVGQFFVANRRSVATQSRVNVFQASNNFQNVDIYMLDRDATFVGDGEGRVANGLNVSLQTLILFDSRNIDVYVTPDDDNTILAGPFPLDLSLGDTVELFVLDTVDPSAVEIRVAPEL